MMDMGLAATILMVVMMALMVGAVGWGMTAGLRSRLRDRPHRVQRTAGSAQRASRVPRHYWRAS
jgi:hypothetical protein